MEPESHTTFTSKSRINIADLDDQFEKGVKWLRNAAEATWDYTLLAGEKILEIIFSRRS